MLTTSVRQIAFVIILILLGSIIFWQLKNFIPAFLGAYTLYILFRKWMFSLTKKLKGRSVLAASILMLATFLMILLPLNGLLGMLTSRIIPTIKQSNELWASAESMIHKLELRFSFEILTENNINSLGQWGVNEMQQVVGATFNGLITVVVMYFILFFMLMEAKTLENDLYKWLPMKEKSATFLKKELNDLVVSNAIGIPLVALIQGIVSLIGYWIAGVQEPFVWFAATCIAAVIPVLGSALIYVPLSIMLIARGMTTQGIFLLLYGSLIIGTVVNVFRFWLQDKIGNTHPLITIFGVIIGLDLFGFIGLIFGPILISLFILLIKIYGKEFNEHNTESL